jgi:predicted DNA-binding transcriptional regulator AlpA
MNQSTILTDVQAGGEVNLSPQTLRNWRSQRRGPPYFKIGRAVRYNLQDLREWMAKHRIVPEK